MKSAVDEVGARKFLGYTCCKRKERAELHISDKSVLRFKDNIRELTKIRGGKSFKQLLRALKPVIRGWANYLGLGLCSLSN